SISCDCTALISGDGAHQTLHSFPTRRSSDLGSTGWRLTQTLPPSPARPPWRVPSRAQAPGHPSARGGSGGTRSSTRDGSSRQWTDRKSTRLNSSHVKISYAVFCLKKKKHEI